MVSRGRLERGPILSQVRKKTRWGVFSLGCVQLYTNTALMDRHYFFVEHHPIEAIDMTESEFKAHSRFKWNV